MFSGGEGVNFNANKVYDANSDGKIDSTEIEAGLEKADGTKPTEEDIKKVTDASFQGTVYKWKDIKEAAQEAVKQHGRFNPGENLGPQEMKTQLGKSLLPKLVNEADNQAGEVRKFKRELADAETSLRAAKTQAERTAGEKAVRTAQTNLRTAQQALQQQINQARGLGATDQQLSRALPLVDDAVQPQTDGGGNFRASMAGPQGGAPQGARAQGVPGGAGGSGGAGFGADPFGGLNAPEGTPGYGAALFMDGQIADGLGNIFASRREGQKLMMLFFYYARMAASGDLGAMYQLTQFLNYIISKDKARQNIKISGKLIELQDKSRKATETLLKADSKDENAFLKELHKAKAEEGTIATSQKLLADMLQEFAHVVEAMTNSAKFMLDAWGRVLRTITRP